MVQVTARSWVKSIKIDKICDVISLAVRIVSVNVHIVSHSCKILQPYGAATTRMHFDAIFSSIGAFE